MTGPNSGPGHNSLLVYVEGQIEYAVRGIMTILDETCDIWTCARTCSAATTSASRSG